MKLPPQAGQYRVILADPPWRFHTWSAGGRDRCPDVRHYETMPLPEIQALPVSEWAARDAVLLLWAIDSMLPQALEVIAAWGFTYRTVGFYWVKLGKRVRHPFGGGFWTRANPEQCLLAARGKIGRMRADVPKLIEAARREHSRKPDEVYERSERLLPGPYLELFARTERDGWDTWGAETRRFGAVARRESQRELPLAEAVR